MSQRKAIVRLLIEDVTLRNNDEPRGIDVAVHWRTGMRAGCQMAVIWS